MENLIGKRILIVDEVDDTRTTLEYAVKELEKDVEEARLKLGTSDAKTEFSIFVLHVSFGPRMLWPGWVLMCWLEQEQGQEGSVARGDAQREQISRGQDGWRCLDLLSLGGCRYRRARCVCGQEAIGVVVISFRPRYHIHS